MTSNLDLAYKFHHNMTRRSKKHWNKDKPTYTDIIISEEFSYFHLFYEWCIVQKGFTKSEYQLDKDILFKGNRIYGSEYCVFVPPILNNFILFKFNQNRHLPMGVMKSGDKFRGNISRFGETVKSSVFASQEQAYEWYVKEKNCYAKELSQLIRQGDYEVDERVFKFFDSFDYDTYVKT